MATITMLTQVECAVRDHLLMAPLFSALEAVIASGALDSDTPAGSSPMVEPPHHCTSVLGSTDKKSAREAAGHGIGHAGE